MEKLFNEKIRSSQEVRNYRAPMIERHFNAIDDQQSVAFSSSVRYLAQSFWVAGGNIPAFSFSQTDSDDYQNAKRKQLSGHEPCKLLRYRV